MLSRFVATAIALMSALPSLAPGGAVHDRTPIWRPFIDTHPAPLFYQAGGIATGYSGNVFIADGGSHRVEKFSPSGRKLATWGTDTPGPLRFAGPRAVSVDGDGSVYLADSGVVKLSYTGRLLWRRTGGALSYPRALAVSGDRTVYVLSLHPVPFSQSFDRITITRLSPAGKTLGTVIYRYPQPAGESALAAAIATTPQGNLLLSLRAQRHCHACDGTYYLLRTISPGGKTLADVSENAGGGSVTVDAGGDVYLTRPNSIEKLSPTGTLITSFGSSGCSIGKLGPDLRVAASRLGTLFVADTQPAATRPDRIVAPFRDGVLHLFALDGTPEFVFGACPDPGAMTLFGQINDLAVTPDRTVYVADGVNSMIYRINAGGTVVGAFRANHPSTVAVDSRGNVYVPNAGVSLDKYSPNGTLLARTTVDVDAAAVASNGYVYGLTPFGQVQLLPPIGFGHRPLRQWWLRGYSAVAAGLSPEGIALDGQGNIFVADVRHNNIQKYSPTGSLLLIWGRGGPQPGRFQNPGAMIVDGRGHLFIDDSGNNRVQEFDLRGRYLASFGRQGQAPGQFLKPEGIGVDRQGHVFVGDRGNDRIQELFP